MENQLTDKEIKKQLRFGVSIQVRLVSDFKKSQAYYRDVLGCKVDDWGHAERDDMIIILQQAISQEDIRPNAPSKKRSDYPTEWEGPDLGWDTFIHIDWHDIDVITEEIRTNGGIFPCEPVTSSHGIWEFKNVYIHDLDKYTIVLGAMRKIKK